jgi:glycosyltransferase involved in cell wall biosynthesis
VRAASPKLRRLGVNAVFLEPRMGGLETYARRLIGALLDMRPDLEIVVFVNKDGKEALAGEPWAPSVSLVTHPLLGRRGSRALSEAFLVGRLALHSRCDLLHSLAMSAPLRPRLPSVVTVPDVTWLRVPGAVPRTTLLLWRTLVIPAARRATRLITNSSSARLEIADEFGIPLEQIDVVPYGPGAEPSADVTSEAELRSRLGLGDGPVVLAVSALLAHKNLKPLIEAMTVVRRDSPNATLVVPANPTPLQDQLVELAEQLGLRNSVVFPGWVSPADLEGLYGLAACFAFPSLREGFGLPVLEAMRRGVPVACSNASALPEVAGDAALLFDPTSAGEIAEAISRILLDQDLAEGLATRGRERARQFSWIRAAEETLATYERALRSSGRQAQIMP